MNERELRILEDLIKRYPGLAVCRDDIARGYAILVNAYEGMGKLLVAGNGGSAADSEHIVGELMKGFVFKRRLDPDMQQSLCDVDSERGALLASELQGTLPAIALTGHPGLTTAYSNDVNPFLGFAQQVYGYGQKGDVFLGITTSGNSENILYAATVARAKGMKVIALTGRDGGQVKDLADVSIIVPEEETYKIQELHLPVYHALCLMLETVFFPE